MILRWELQRDGSTWYAYSGELVVGMAGRRSYAPGRVWYSATSAVFMNHIARGNGEVSSIRTAKAAVERAWATWLDLAGLARRPDHLPTANGAPSQAPDNAGETPS